MVFSIRESSLTPCPESDTLLRFWSCAIAVDNATVVLRVVVEGHEEKLFALKDSWRELCRKPEVFFYERIQKHKEELAWVGLVSFMGSLDLGEEQGAESSHHTCSAMLRGGKQPDRHDRSHMRTLTYPVSQKLSTFTSTKQLVVAL